MIAAGRLGRLRTASTAMMMTAAACLEAGGVPIVQRIDDFETGDLSAWQSSMSPEYYKGGAGRKGLEVVDDPVQGRVLRCNVRFTDTHKSEPVFITRRLDPSPRRMDVVGVRFKAFLTASAIDANGGFKVRLRTSPRTFVDYDVQAQLGRPFPVGEWVSVSLDASIGSNVRNVWGQILGNVGQMTFRLDDVDDRNADFALLLDDIELVLRQPVETMAYTPRASPRPRRGPPRVLFLKHRAAGYYGLRAAVAAVAPDARVDTFFYRGYHFEFFGFPESRQAVLAYDLIIILDVDPIMMTAPQCRRIADAVASGAHLLFFGGPVTLTHAKDFKAALRSVLPVTFRTGAGDAAVRARPARGPDHYLNRGLDPGGLGTVAAVQAVKPKPGALVPWTAGGEPLVVTLPVQKGRATLVNTWPHVANSATGGFFTSTLSDDLMRRLIRFGLGRTAGPGITRLSVSTFVVTGTGRVVVRVGTDGVAAVDALRLLLDGRPIAPVAGSVNAGPGNAEFALDFTAGVASVETHEVRVEVRTGDRVRDVRDFTIRVENPLELDLAWKHSKYTFAPGSPVEFTAALRSRGLPRVTPGATTTIADADGAFSVRVVGFADAWVYKSGSDYLIHNQKGATNVKVTSGGGVFPEWTIAGDVRCARADGSHRFAEDDRILACRRTVRIGPGGAVTVNTQYTFRADMRVHRLPLTVQLPASVFAGLPFEVAQAGKIRKGILPEKTTRGRIFDGKGLDLTVQTARGPLRIEVTDPALRVWMRDLRQYDMPSFRIEIEAPFMDQRAAKGDVYTIPLRITPPARARGGPGNPVRIPAELTRAAPKWRAVLRDPRSGYAWTVPVAKEDGASVRFAGTLPDLAPGEYRMEIAALHGNREMVRTTQACFVVSPLDRTGFFPIMSIIGIAADGHYLDEEGIKERVRDLIDHGFNTAAIAAIGAFRTDTPDNAQRLNAYAESFAQQCGMATTFEYSSLQVLRRRGKTGPCVFDPAYPDVVKQAIAWRIEAARRTPRLLSVKVIDEPYLGIKNMDFCTHCQTEFRRRFGIPMPRKVPPESEVYARWALARFISGYVSRAYATTADVVRGSGATFDLLLTYMATGLGYQKPLKSQQDALDWSRYVQRADFDVYPYFYPRSQRIRMVRAGFCMAFMRDVARSRGIPWGFYVELDDRNWPFQKNPKEASAECAFTAVARGANYLNTFIHRVVGTGTQARPERWEAAGKALRLIRRLGPMLRVMPAVRANLAFCYPNTQEAVGNGYERPDYFLAALGGGFGDVDICNERTVLETGDIPYRALVLWKTDFIHAEFAPTLAKWLRAGGVLFCDRLPRRTHRGDTLGWDIAHRPVGPGERIGTLRFAVSAVGKGRIVRLDNDVQTEFRGLAEAEPMVPGKTGAYRRALGSLFRRFVQPNVSVDFRETPSSVDRVEAGFRGNADAALLIVVNHQPEAQTVTVRLRRAGFAAFVDAETAEPVAFQKKKDGTVVLSVSVDGRWARCIAAFRARPARLDLEVPGAAVPRGGTLRYRVRVLGPGGRPVRGGVPLMCDVRGPNGGSVPRFGGAHAPVDGVFTLTVPVPLNAVRGRYTIAVSSPLFPVRAACSFEVQNSPF